MVGEAEGSPNQQPSRRGDWLFPPQHVDIHDGGELCRGYIHVKTNVFLASQCGNSMKTESLLEMFSIGFAKAQKSLFTAGVDCQTC